MSRIAAAAVLFAYSALLGGLSPAAGAEAVALISSITGKVEVKQAGEQSWRAVRLGDQLFDGDVLQTQDRSRASLLFANGSIVTVQPASRLTLSLRGPGGQGEASRTAAVSKYVLEGIGGIFSADRKRETLTAVPGIRKEAGEDEAEVTVLYPRNSLILEQRPGFRWETRGKNRMFTVSLTVKGMAGRLFSLSTKNPAAPYPGEQTPLARGQTYFIRVESAGDAGVSEEVYFRVADERNNDEANRLTAQMEALRRAGPDDTTPEFVLAAFCKNKGLYHLALQRLEELEKKNPKDRFVLEEKREILAKMGLFRRLAEVDRQLATQ